MKRLNLSLAAAFALAMPIVASSAFAQSSGNFAAQVLTPQCVLSSADGSLSGGIAGTEMDTSIKTPNSSQTALLITPSLVTGLYTNTNIYTSKSLSSETAAVVVHVTMDGNPVAPDTGSGVIYDERFQQLSSTLFSQLTECANNDNCNIDLVLSTASAHSFNFVAPSVGGGNHHLVVTWSFLCDNGTGTLTAAACSSNFTKNSAAACAGPGSLTVQQVDAFSQSGGVNIQ
ncbi:MAG: hypothetical protein IVW54_16360 [Candidatus Binataceae bacterium]|nr:hypothetical protein [Candidatus Binataceae bacterium]